MFTSPSLFKGSARLCPRVRKVIHALDSVAPLSLAETSWDNVGLLVDSFSHESQENDNLTVLVTNDFTIEVLAEAISLNSKFIISYHPVIFKSLKVLGSTTDWKGSLAALAIKHGISIYSPHTSLDVACHGMNDFLAKGIFGTSSIAELVPIYKQAKNELPIGHEESGFGRIATLNQPLQFSSIVENTKRFLSIPQVRVCFPENKQMTSYIKRIAFGVGNGGSFIEKLINTEEKVDLFITGELSHHQLLDCVQNDLTVILTEHSNCERVFLKEHLTPLLNKIVENETRHVKFIMSSIDKDPVTIL